MRAAHFGDALARFLTDGQAKSDAIAVFTACLDASRTPPDEDAELLLPALAPVIADPECAARLAALVIALGGLSASMIGALAPAAGVDVEQVPSMMATAALPIELLRRDDEE